MSEQKQFAGDPTNPALLRALEALQKEQSEGAKKRMHDALCDAFLLIPTRNLRMDVPKDQWAAISKNTSIEIATIRHPDGNAMPVFTDKASLLKWKGERTTYVAMHAGVVIGTALNSGLVAMTINPGNPSVAVVSKAELQQLLPIARERAKNAKPPVNSPPGQGRPAVRIGKPESLPQELAEKIGQAAGAEEAVSEAYVFQVTPPNVPGRRAVGVALKDAGTRESIEPMMQRIAEAIRPGLAQGEAIELAVLAGPNLETVRKIGVKVYP